MNLYIFPEGACLDNGYGIGVDYAYKKLNPDNDDLIVWYTILDKDKMLYLKPTDVVLRKNKFFSFKSIMNIIRGHDRTELNTSDLSFLKDFNFENIHCDEVIFYRALKEMFPNKQMTLRLHNCFARIADRKDMLNQKLDWKYAVKLKAMYKLEREIFNDKKIFKIFISDEDRSYYTSTFGKFSDSETWAYSPNDELMRMNQLYTPAFTHKLVWFGGVESHKKASIDWFINSVLPEVKSEIPDVELHLWGRNTQCFDNPSIGVFGHGFYDGEGFPLKDSLYINPDIIGGGIKLKLLTLMENGIPFISSPFGFEGYSKDLIDNKFCHVVEDDLWSKYIIHILK